MTFLKLSIECHFFSNVMVSFKILMKISSQIVVESVNVFLKNEPKQEKKKYGAYIERC